MVPIFHHSLALTISPCFPLLSYHFQALSEASDAISVRGGGEAAAAPAKGGVDVGLSIYFFLWYLGNYYVSY
jgi:hypothetical protein